MKTKQTDAVTGEREEARLFLKHLLHNWEEIVEELACDHENLGREFERQGKMEKALKHMSRARSIRQEMLTHSK